MEIGQRPLSTLSRTEAESVAKRQVIIPGVTRNLKEVKRMSEKKMEEKTEVPQKEEAKTTEAQVKELLDAAFVNVVQAAELVGTHPEVERMWKGMSAATLAVWLVEEAFENINVLGQVATFADKEDYVRANAQVAFADGLNDATGLIELGFGGFGADRIREFSEAYIKEQEDRNRDPAFWYGAILRRSGNAAYGAHKSGDEKQKSPKVRQAIGRQVLQAKAKKKGWNTTTQPKPRLHISLCADIDVASGKKAKGFGSTVTLGLSNAGSYTVDEIVAKIGELEFDKDFIYAAKGSNMDKKTITMVQKALKGSKLDKLVAFKGAIKTAIRGKDLNTVEIIQFIPKGANLKVDGRPAKTPAKDWDVKVIGKGE